MRARGWAAVAVLVVVFGSPAAGRAEVRHVVVERVDASFIYRTPTKGQFDYLVFYAIRKTDPGSGRVLSAKGYAGMGECVRTPRGGGLPCQTRLDRYKVARFEVNRSFTEVRVVLRRAGKSHLLRFSTREDYQATGWELPNECGAASVRGYEVARSAVARGRLFGRRVSSGSEWRRDIESVGRYVEVAACP